MEMIGSGYEINQVMVIKAMNKYILSLLLSCENKLIINESMHCILTVINDNSNFTSSNDIKFYQRPKRTAPSANELNRFTIVYMTG